MPAPTLPDLHGKTAIVTGANTGIGRATALALGRAGAHVYVGARTQEKAQPVIDEIVAAGGRADALLVDFADLASVRAAASSFLETNSLLHILVNNAGLAGQRGLTKDGFELTFGVNHLGPYLFTRLLLDRLKSSSPSRIVNVASEAHYRVKAIDWDAQRARTRTTTGFPEYGVSKLCNVLFTRELSRRLAGTNVSVYALHPGVIASDIWRRVPWPIRPLMRRFMKTPEEGAWTSLYCATSPDVATKTGLYWDEQKEKRPSRLAQDDALAAELWRRSAEWTQLPA
jgi:NAD(P)-dependent dehydrogenase (short-subunit alcohol dehydrogenase family)